MQKNKTKHQFLIKTREDVGIKNLNDPKVFIEYRQKNKNFNCV